MSTSIYQDVAKKATSACRKERSVYDLFGPFLTQILAPGEILGIILAINIVIGSVEMAVLLPIIDPMRI